MRTMTTCCEPDPGREETAEQQQRAAGLSPSRIDQSGPYAAWPARPASLVYSCRKWLAEKGTGPEVLKELMRHSTIAMSLDGYGRGDPEANRAANATVVSELLNGL